MINALKPLSLVCLAALLAGCGQNSGSNAMKGETQEKVPSPDGTVAATTTREPGNDKTPVRFHVYVQRLQDPAQAVEVLDVERSEAPILRWVGPNGLQVALECGSIHRFSNFADVSSTTDKAVTEQVVVLLDNRGVCPAAPPAVPNP